MTLKPPPPPPPKSLPPLVKPAFDATPPHSLESEKGVVGSCLLDANALDTVTLIVSPEDFYDHACRTVYGHLYRLCQEGKRIDTTILVDCLRTAGELEHIGGIGFIGSLVTSVPHAAHAADYARTVADKAILRAAITVATQVVSTANAFKANGEKVLTDLEEKVHTLREKRSASNESVTKLADVLAQGIQLIHKRKRGDAEQPLATGLVDLDRVLRITRKQLIVLAARPSMGKSALATNIAQHAATQGPVLFVSLEMSKVEITDRMMSAWSQVTLGRIIDGSVTDYEVKRILEVNERVSQLPLYIDDTPSRTVQQIASIARRIKRMEKGLSLIVVDYIQLIEPSDPRDPRQEQVSKISRRLKVLARELNVPILVLAQLNRQTEHGSDNRPRLSHLRESGAIEQDADVVMFVHRPEYFEQTEEAKAKLRGQAQIIIAKQRNGMAGVDVECLWQPDLQRFVNQARVIPEHDLSGELVGEPDEGEPEFDF